ncbi:helix-turn-helix transcriptional regulator [Microbulbifer agarilyticus]|uniref:helix-turn-helix transcriptional regulator n=1 Tax=Microbulbifer agarilyticus TaxID=260552 RepID=UPI001C93BBFC|nr:helix-turn-helix transcriptional regulator [Microbulbifer agarilyticus]MBY6212377.1 helix-turn-helix transcriptional regulator [Microbulbifer agarilyticus]
MDKYTALAERVAKLEAKLKQTQALVDRLYEDAEQERLASNNAVDEGISLDNLLRRLTDRQALILGGVLENFSSEEIAKLGNISPNTVRTHMRYIYKKAEVNQRHQLITKYQRYWEQMDDETFERLTGGKVKRPRFEKPSN